MYSEDDDSLTNTVAIAVNRAGVTGKHLSNWIRLDFYFPVNTNTNTTSNRGHVSLHNTLIVPLPSGPLDHGRLIKQKIVLGAIISYGLIKQETKGRGFGFN